MTSCENRQLKTVINPAHVTEPAEPVLMKQRIHGENREHVSKETVVLRRWEYYKIIYFYQRVDNVNWPPQRLFTVANSH